MDVDGPFVKVYVSWICWIVSTIDFFNRFSFSQLITLFVFFIFLSLNICYSVVLLFVATLASTTFTFVVIICISTTGWTFAISTNFPWNIFCISINFKQFVILCQFKPHIWHAYEDVFCVCHCNLLLLLSTCFHIVISHSIIWQYLFSLPYIIVCFWWCCMFSTKSALLDSIVVMPSSHNIATSLCCYSVEIFIPIVIIIRYDYKFILDIVVKKLSVVSTCKP